jgi:peptide/nickel transport system substrate-binding protein
MEKKASLLSIFLVLLLLLAACGGNNSNAGNANKNGEPKSGGQLIYARGSDSISLDPINVTDGESIRVTQNMFETLFQYDVNLELQPKLAESYRVSDDGLTWTLSLKQGVKFQDGTDFNADAVVFNFERWMDPENPYHTGGDFTYYPFLYGGFKGDPNHKIEYVKAVDENTVEIKLTEKIAPFISYLAIPMFGISSPDAIKKYGEDYGEHPVGTGPFKFDSWAKNDKITISKNEDYYGDKPYIDGIIFRVIPDNSARLTALQTGEVDLVDGMNPEDAGKLEGNQNFKIIDRPSFNFGIMAMNTEIAPFDNVKVRQAINMAINKQEIVDAFYSGYAEVAKNPLPPTLWGYNDDIEDYEYDPKEAKKLLAEAGYPDGFDTEIYTMSNARPYMPQPIKVAEAIQSDLKEIGINAKIQTFEWATYLEKASNGEHQLALFGWTGVMADPDNFLTPNLSAANAEKPANNYAFWKNEEFTSLLDQARVTFDQDERANLYKHAQEIFHEEAPWVPLAHTTPPIAMASYVEGFTAHPMEQDNFAKVYLNK